MFTDVNNACDVYDEYSGRRAQKLVPSLGFANAIDRLQLMEENSAQAKTMNNRIAKLTIA